MEYDKQLSLADFYDLPDADLFERAHRFADFLDMTRAHHHLQYRRISTSGSAPVMQVIDPYTGAEREMIYFGSNDYLNLTRHPRVIAAGRAALEKYGAGAGSVPLLGGTLDLHIELEQAVARFKACESAILFTSGFGSNSGALLAMLGDRDCAILDLYVHASIIDGCAHAKK
jgi:glycine C-acetyltransferase